MRHFYAFAGRYGAKHFLACDKPIGRIRAFTSKATRDAWVEDGPDWRHDKGHCEPVTAAWLRKHFSAQTISSAQLECAGQRRVEDYILDEQLVKLLSTPGY